MLKNITVAKKNFRSRKRKLDGIPAIFLSDEILIGILIRQKKKKKKKKKKVGKEK